MVFRFQTTEGHDGACGQGHSLASTRSSVESALSAAYDIDSSEIVVSILGPYVVLKDSSGRRAMSSGLSRLPKTWLGRAMSAAGCCDVSLPTHM
jgi:hypothetical protein